MPIEIDGPVQIIKVPEMGPYNNNGYIIADPKTKEAYIIDAPAQVSVLLAEAADYHVKAVLITHSHPDHIAGYTDLKLSTDLPVGIHIADANKLPEAPEFYLEHDMELNVGSQKFKTLHTPGHTPGGVCFVSDQFLISGDTLFPGGPGMTRSPQSFREIVQSISNQLLILPGNALVLPGHGLNTYISDAREEFELFEAKEWPTDLFGTVRWDQFYAEIDDPGDK